MHWPLLDECYTDEFGFVDPRVHNAAGSLWPAAERYALSKLGDEQCGLRLMIKAAATVSRRLVELEGSIDSLAGFLWTTYRRLVLAELRKLNGRRVIESEFEIQLIEGSDRDVEVIERHILIEELCRRMDDWTRKVFELRTLGYGFEMMGAELGMKANAIRARFSREVMRVQSEVDMDSRAAAERVSRLTRDDG